MGQVVVLVQVVGVDVNDGDNKNADVFFFVGSSMSLSSWPPSGDDCLSSFRGVDGDGFMSTVWNVLFHLGLPTDGKISGGLDLDVDGMNEKSNCFRFCGLTVCNYSIFEIVCSGIL